MIGRTGIVTTMCATLSLLAAVGCASGGLTDEQMEATVEQVLAANAAVQTASFDLTMQAKVDVSGPEATESVTVSGMGGGVVDSANQRMRLSMQTTLQSPAQGEMVMPLEYYLVDGWMYVSVGMEGREAQWMKLRMPEDMWHQQSQVEQQLELLKTATGVTYLGTESVGGVQCYAVEVVPNIDSIQQMAAQAQGQMAGFGDYDLGSMDLSGMIQSVSVRQYVAIETYLIMRSDQHMVLEITPASLGISGGDFDTIVEEITTTMLFRDYGKPATIQLPQGALAAIEMGAS